MQTNNIAEKIRKYCAKAVDIVKRYDLLIFLFGLTFIGIALRLAYFDYESNDYKVFLLKWYNTIKGYEGLSGFGATIGDYTPIYKYMITVISRFDFNPLYCYKGFSCVFDLLTAVFVGLIVRRVSGSDVKALLSYGVILLLPNVFLNSAIWAQCDSIFTCFCVMSLYYAMKGKSRLAMGLYGLSFAFKLQAIFFAPAIVVFILRGKIKPLSVLYAFAVYIVCALPAVIAGMSFSDALFGAYTKQVNEYAKISLNAPNLYNILSTKYMSDKNLSTLLVIMTVGIVALFSIYLYKKKGETGDGDMIVISYLFALLMPYFLPHMHERYFYLADIFAVLFAFSYKKKAYISVITIYASLRVVVKYLFDSSGSNINLVNIGILMTVGVAMLVLFIVNGENTKTRGCNGFDRV